jgi:putative acetyltransferase
VVSELGNALGIDVRHEQPGDEAAIRRVNDEAFGQPDESRIVDAVRAAGHSVISLVAVEGTRIIGHILFTPVSIETAVPAPRALGLGPMAVSPEWQRQGVGSRLVKAGLDECRRLGHEVVIVIGHPEFYPRFGFRPGHAFGLRSTFDVPDDVFMVAALTPGVPARLSGLVRYVPQFA